MLQNSLNLKFLFQILLLSLPLFSCSAQNGEKSYQDYLPAQQYVCYQTNTPINIDGKDLEASWQAADWTEAFVDIEGDQKAKPTWETKVKMLWDETHFYFFAKMEEPHIWATLKNRDDIIYHDDDFEIFIDPDGDGHHYYEFEINAFNTLWDLLMLHPYHLGNPPNYLFHWNIPDIKTAVHIEGTINDPNDTDQYWSVEWAIPWSALKEMNRPRRSPQDGDQWRLNFSRVDWPVEVINSNYQKIKDPATGKNLPERNWVWAPTGRVDMHRPEQWGSVQFSKHKVGDKKVAFQLSAEEDIKAGLWDLFYQQKAMYKKNGQYTNKLNIPILKDGPLPVEINIGVHSFEITCPASAGDNIWIIRQDGRLQFLKP